MKTSKVGNELMSVIEIAGAVQNLEAQMIETSPGQYVRSNQKGKYAKKGIYS